MSDQYTREQMLRYLKDKGALTKLTTEDFLKRIELAKANGSPMSFSRENLSGIDLSQKTIQRIFVEGGYSESNPPIWYSGELKKELLIKRPDIIASARDPAASEVVNKSSIDLEGADFSNADLVCANFEGADLARTNFEGARLHYANLSHARLWDANFCHARLNSVDLSGSAMQNAIFFWASLRGALVNKSLLYHVKLEHTELSRSQVNEIWEESRARDIRKQKKDARRHFADAAIAYNMLKNNFRSIGRIDDASWAFVKERRMERNTYKRFSWRWLSSWFLDITCTYGEYPWKVFFLTVATVIFFSLVYWWLNLVNSLFLPDNIVFSLGSFVTVTFTGLEASNIPARVLMCVEAGLGISLFALLMYSLGRRMGGE
jgi:uncharacterized protein YjbI with pentapeptide repeats